MKVVLYMRSIWLFRLQLLANERTECECESERQVWGVVQRYFVILFVRTTEQLLK